jgi:hypothetical protein
MLKNGSSYVLGRVSPCGVALGYVSIATLPAALLETFLSILHGVEEESCSSDL